jgi:hypothetical protein
VAFSGGWNAEGQNKILVCSSRIQSNQHHLIRNLLVVLCLSTSNCFGVVKIDIDNCWLTCQVFCEYIWYDRRYSRITTKILICQTYDTLVLFDSNSCSTFLAD